MKKHHKRQLWLGLVIAAVYAGALFALFPDPVGTRDVVFGPVSEYKSCSSKGCDYGIQVGDVVLACGVDMSGPTYACPRSIVPGVSAMAFYYRQSTLMSAIGLSPKTSIALVIEQGEHIVIRRSPEDIRRKYLYPGSFFWAFLCVILLFGLRKHRFFRA